MKYLASIRLQRALACIGLLALVTLLVNCRNLIPQHSWDQAWGTLVPHESFPGDCSLCHVPERWDELRKDFQFDHSKETGFILEGVHADAACLRCHNDRGPVDVYVARGCGGCHVDPHRGRLGLDCEDCHNSRSWLAVGALQDHAMTRFPLLGNHAVTPCESCHQQSAFGDFRGLPIQCHLCHQRDASLAVPNHIINGWITNCDQCHTPIAWDQTGFNHDFFPLAGGHGGLECTQCHAGGFVGGLNPDCVACHLNDYTNAPNHVASGFSLNCTDCHNTNAWK